MKNLLSISFFIIISLMLFSCKTTNDTVEKETANKEETASNEKKSEEEIMYDKMGTEMCDCMKDMLTTVNKMKDATPEEQQAIAMKLQGISAEVEGCIKGLMPKYPDIDFEANNNPKAEAALLRNCPEYRETKNVDQ